MAVATIIPQRSTVATVTIIPQGNDDDGSGSGDHHPRQWR